MSGGTIPGGMMGVRSKSKDESIRLYLGRNHYNEWMFIYVGQQQMPGGGGRGQPGGVGGPGGRGGPGPGGGPPGFPGGPDWTRARRRRPGRGGAADATGRDSPVGGGRGVCSGVIGSLGRRRQFAVCSLRLQFTVRASS